MLIGALFAVSTAATPATHAVSLGATGCACLENRDRGQYGPELSMAAVAGARIQYDYSFASRVFAGAALGHEQVWRAHRIDSNGVSTAGVVVGRRWQGALVGAGLRGAAGFAFDLGQRPAIGGYFEAGGELTARTGQHSELFLDLSVLSVRSLAFLDPPPHPAEPSWAYFSVIVPPMIAAGVRFLF